MIGTSLVLGLVACGEQILLGDASTLGEAATRGDDGGMSSNAPATSDADVSTNTPASSDADVSSYTPVSPASWEPAEGQSCNGVTNTAASNPVTCSDDPFATETGGTLVDGTYELGAMMFFSVPACSYSLGGSFLPTGATFQSTAVLHGNTLDVVSDGSDGFSRTTYQLSMSGGNQMTLTVLCSTKDAGIGTPQAVTYLADPAGFHLQFTNGSQPHFVGSAPYDGSATYFDGSVPDLNGSQPYLEVWIRK
jgi:hypothetical protein